MREGLAFIGQLLNICAREHAVMHISQELNLLLDDAKESSPGPTTTLVWVLDMEPTISFIRKIRSIVCIYIDIH